jgi:hypothetical protein
MGARNPWCCKEEGKGECGSEGEGSGLGVVIAARVPPSGGGGGALQRVSNARGRHASE